MRNSSRHHKAFHFLNPKPLNSMQTEQQQDHAQLEKFVLGAALTCIATMLYLLNVSIFS